MYDDVNWFCIILCFVTNLMSYIQLNECVAMCVYMCCVSTGLSMRTGGHTWVVFCSQYHSHTSESPSSHVLALASNVSSIYISNKSSFYLAYVLRASHVNQRYMSVMLIGSPMTKGGQAPMAKSGDSSVCLCTATSISDDSYQNIYDCDTPYMYDVSMQGLPNS